MDDSELANVMFDHLTDHMEYLADCLVCQVVWRHVEVWRPGIGSRP